MRVDIIRDRKQLNNSNNNITLFFLHKYGFQICAIFIKRFIKIFCKDTFGDSGIYPVKVLEILCVTNIFQSDAFYTEKVRPEVVLLIKLFHTGERCLLNRNRSRLPETSLNK